MVLCFLTSADCRIKECSSSSFTVKETIIQHFNYRWRYFVTGMNWLIKQMSRFFIFWPVRLKQASRKCLFLNSCSRHLQFVSGTWSWDSDLALVHQSPGKVHLQPSAETDSVSQAISLNRSCWMNAFVPHSLPVVVSYCKGVTVKESTQHFLSCHTSCHVHSFCDFIVRFYLSCSFSASKCAVC